MTPLELHPADIPLAISLRIISGVLNALHYVHERRDEYGQQLRLIHRDVSPQNVLLTFHGAVKLIDFGLARPSNQLGHTRAGRVKGTVPYMSPEQCRGRHLDRRSDVFSTGILLYELTVGRRLFVGKNEFDVFQKIVNGDILRPTAVRADYPAVLEPVVMRALERAPADRYQTASELHDALDHVERTLGLALPDRALQVFLRDRFADGNDVSRDLAGVGRKPPALQVTQTSETEGAINDGSSKKETLAKN